MHSHHEQKTLLVVIITAVTMVVEILFGLATNSMALLADGIHMASHVLAIGLSWISYVIIRKLSKKETFLENPEKILSLSGYTSGLLLIIFAFVILYEAIGRILNPIQIEYNQAIIIAIIGLIVNIICAIILHHKHSESDHSIRAAYIHVIADALTSVTAIVGLCAAMIWNIIWLDAIGALISSVVIIKWSVSLLKTTGIVLVRK